ncbi:hypothetical protein Lal_00043776 [Lupinus albus]|nr:hypothetical protein Lal_00043776 [Lupinus albus]
MFGNLPLRATDMPLKGTRRPTSFRAERVTLEASACPRDAHNYPSRHCEARPAPQQSTLFRGTRRLERLHFRMIGNLPLRATDMTVKASPSATTFRAGRVTLEASARPRDDRNYPL